MARPQRRQDRKSTRLNSSHVKISYAVFCLKKKKKVIVEPVLGVLVQLEFQQGAVSHQALVDGHTVQEFYLIFLFFFFNDTATTEIYTLSLHDALPIRTPCSWLVASRGYSSAALSRS